MEEKKTRKCYFIYGGYGKDHSPFETLVDIYSGRGCWRFTPQPIRSCHLLVGHPHRVEGEQVSEQV